jgi:alkylhydroperoxidase/carboxymuconolactone decarboxylase family protein YurZ
VSRPGYQQRDSPSIAILYEAVHNFRYDSRRGPLDPKSAELIALAVRASACILDRPGISEHVDLALAAGASAEEIVDMLATIAPLGNHAFSGSLDVIESELEAAGMTAEAPPLTARSISIKANFIEARGYWTDLRERLAQQVPDYFERYMKLSLAPWTQGVLDPKTRELAMVAVDACVPHMYMEGVRLHVRKAISFGATRAELLAVLEIVSALGASGFDHAIGCLQRRLQPELDERST